MVFWSSAQNGEELERRVAELERSVEWLKKQIASMQNAPATKASLDHALLEQMDPEDAAAISTLPSGLRKYEPRGEWEKTASQLQNPADDACKEKQTPDAQLDKGAAEIKNLQGSLNAKDSEIVGLMQKTTIMEQELKQKNEALQAANAQIARFSGLPLEELAGLKKMLEGIDAPFRDIAHLYYNLDNPVDFLCQCGQFARLRQFWEGCFDAVLKGARPGDIAAFLEYALGLHNRAFADNAGRALSAKPGKPYDFNTQHRLGGNGAKVARVILPGLIQPNGAIAVKCLVDLNS